MSLAGIWDELRNWLVTPAWSQPAPVIRPSEQEERRGAELADRGPSDPAGLLFPGRSRPPLRPSISLASYT